MYYITMLRIRMYSAKAVIEYNMNLNYFTHVYFICIINNEATLHVMTVLLVMCEMSHVISECTPHRSALSQQHKEDRPSHCMRPQHD